MDSAGRARPRLVTPAFLAVAVATLAYFVADGITLPVTPLFVVGPLAGDELAVGVTIGAFSVSALLLRPWVGRIADRRGRRPLIVGGCALFAVAMLGHLVAVTLPILIAMRLLLGAAEAMLFVGSLTAINDLAPDARRGEAVSFFSLSLYLGVAIGPLIGEAVLGDGRYAAAWVAAAVAAAAAALVSLRVPETRPTEAPNPDAQPVVGWRRFVHPAGILPGVTLLTGAWGLAGFLAFVPLHAQALGMGGSRFVFLVFAAVVIGFRLFGARIPDLLGARRAARIALAVGAVGLAVMAGWAAPAGLYVGAAVYGFGIAFAFPALSALAVASAPPRERGAVLGTFSAFLDLGFGLGPFSMGAVAALFGYAGAFLFAAMVALLGLGLLFAFRMGEPRRITAAA